MAIARDATSSSTTSGWSNLGTSYSLSHTCAASSVLVVYVETGSVADVVTGVTYNGVAMTQIKKQARSDSALFGYLYFLGTPSTGANNITVSLSAAESSGIVCGSSYTGASTSNPTITAGDNATSTTCTVTMTTTVDNSWLVGGFYTGGGAMTVGANTTKIGGATNTAMMVDTNAAQTPTGSKSMSMTIGGSAANIGVGLVLSPFVAPITSIPDARVFFM